MGRHNNAGGFFQPGRMWKKIFLNSCSQILYRKPYNMDFSNSFLINQV